MPLLEISGLVAGYGAVSVLHDLALHVNEHEAVALVGANAAGKTTLLRTISGIVPARAGSIRLGGRELLGLGSHEIAAAGIVQVAEGRQLFPEMSVLENLHLGHWPARKDKAAEKRLTDQMMDLFPRLRERAGQAAGTLSGGEQQMLAVARALMSEPKLLLVDELSLGLAPIVVRQLFEAISEVNRLGTAVLLVEQFVHLALQYTSRAYVLARGEVAIHGVSSDLLASPDLMAAYLGESAAEAVPKPKRPRRKVAARRKGAAKSKMVKKK